MIMEPEHSAEMSKHLERQNQALMGTYRAMSHELHKLQIEEETTMRKLYELMCGRSYSKEAVLLLAKILEFHSTLKNIMDRRERKEQKDKHKNEKQSGRDVKESTLVGKQRTEP